MIGTTIRWNTDEEIVRRSTASPLQTEKNHIQTETIIILLTKVFFIKRSKSFLTTLLSFLQGLLGMQLQGCDKDDVGEEEYGCPYVEFNVKGAVTDTEGKGIKYAKLKLERVHTSESGQNDRYKVVEQECAIDGTYSSSLWTKPRLENSVLN